MKHVYARLSPDITAHPEIVIFDNEGGTDQELAIASLTPSQCLRLASSLLHLAQVPTYQEKRAASLSGAPLPAADVAIGWDA